MILPSARVSVVIPTTGRESLIDAVRTATAQSESKEVIVVLDRPERTDTVQAMLRPFPATLLETSGNCGGSASRNLGTDQASGEFVAYLDDDDWWELGKLAPQVALLDSESDANISATRYVFHTASGDIRLIPRRLPEPYETIASYVVTRDRLHFGTTCLQSSSLLVRTGAAQQTRWNESLIKHQDWDFVIRVTGNSPEKLVWVQKYLTHIAQGSTGSVSRKPSWEASYAWLEQRSELLSRKARADFAATQILRAALGARSWRGVTSAIASTAGTLPHWPALLVGLSGLRGA
jgi:glycosyltransferase involved in cell wall biosynthesis